MYLRILLLLEKAKSFIREDSNSLLIICCNCCKEFSAALNFVLLTIVRRMRPTFSSHSVNAIQFMSNFGIEPNRMLMSLCGKFTNIRFHA